MEICSSASKARRVGICQAEAKAKERLEYVRQAFEAKRLKLKRKNPIRKTCGCVYGSVRITLLAPVASPQI
ncbi:hypothetical protein Hamer_G014882 [Homarus americanus]|uniref:Uncharacterized protein n=1 Tax=Homarus americanus TaxID=6706 RepID=A0A8J5MNW4_HOMAM|nr:hypothetical protein Hamer_G014882 [Homarus americanus]